jgi:hypothetical protein
LFLSEARSRSICELFSDNAIVPDAMKRSNGKGGLFQLGAKYYSEMVPMVDLAGEAFSVIVKSKLGNAAAENA